MAHVLSVVADADVPLDVWREFGYGKDAVRREGFKRFLLGSVSEAVAMTAYCSVAVVRERARSSRRGRAL